MDRRTFCPYGGKISYVNFEQANRELKRLVGRQRNKKRGRPYRCPKCHAVHITSATTRDER